VGTSPHGGLDVNRGPGVLRHGRVTSPVYGVVGKIDPLLGRIVIHEVDPVSGELTGYDVEILHTQTQTVKRDDPVKPRQQRGTQGDVGAPGNFHAHLQVYHGDRTPLNPLRHLFEYHHPDEPIPPAGRGPFISWEEAAVDALVHCAPYAARHKDCAEKCACTGGRGCGRRFEPQ